MNPDHAAIDPARCPLCGAPNLCACEAGRASGQPQPPGWCAQAHFPPQLLERLPEAARGKACICAACVRQTALHGD
jgi:hypothetical protein